MEDFASAAMMRIVVAGLARQGLQTPLGAPEGARFPLGEKRSALASILAAHGPMAILRIGDAVWHMPPEPLGQALLNATGVADLLSRWKRLETFSHSRHEVVIERTSPGEFGLRHQAREDGPPPVLPETLLVMGVLVSLAEGISGQPLCFGPEGSPPWRRDGLWSEWHGLIPPDRFVLSGTPEGPAHPPPATVTGENLTARLRTQVRMDPIRRWTLADFAACADMTPRTMQRRLAGENSSMSRLVAEARLEVAASYLCDRSGPGLAEIGFLSGYTDQAHFARSFTKGAGTTPRAYRADFAR